MTDVARAAAPGPAPSKKKGVIHDLGYARYAGERRAPSTLWRVIMRHQIREIWKTWWRLKVVLILCAILTVTVGAIIYFSQDAMFEPVRRNGAAVKFLDGIIPATFTWYRYWAFGLTMTAISTTIARDRETGAFGFYFCRPVRAYDYVLGKLAGTTIMMATVTLAGPVLLTAFRIGLAKNTDEMLRLLPWLGRAVMVGGLSAIVMSILPLTVSALVNRRWIALVVWAGYWIIGSGMLTLLGVFAWKPLLALDPGLALQSLAYRLWDVDFGEPKLFMSATTAVIGLSIYIGAAFALLRWRIGREAINAVGVAS